MRQLTNAARLSCRRRAAVRSMAPYEAAALLAADRAARCVPAGFRAVSVLAAAARMFVDLVAAGCGWGATEHGVNEPSWPQDGTGCPLIPPRALTDPPLRALNFRYNAGYVLARGVGTIGGIGYEAGPVAPARNVPGRLEATVPSYPRGLRKPARKAFTALPDPKFVVSSSATYSTACCTAERSA